jgi:hypothetical protein
MLRAKQAAKRRAAKKTVPVLGAAGFSLALAGSAAATTNGAAVDIRPAANNAPNHEIILGEEEISDVSLATFYVFDTDNPKTGNAGVRLAGGCGGCRGCRGCGCRGCGCGFSCRSCGWSCSCSCSCSGGWSCSCSGGWSCSCSGGWSCSGSCSCSCSCSGGWSCSCSCSCSCCCSW